MVKKTAQQTAAIKALTRKYGNPPTREGRDGRNIILHYNRPGELTARMYRVAPDGVTTAL